MEALAERFTAAVRDLRAQAAGTPREDATTRHQIVANGEHGRGEMSEPIPDLSE